MNLQPETEVKTAPTLKPCPFCGSTYVDPEGWMAGDRTTGPACDDCGGSAKSVERWNTRPLEAFSDDVAKAIVAERERLQNRVAELERVNEQLCDANADMADGIASLSR